jgi:hypothetical protein
MNLVEISIIGEKNLEINKDKQNGN